MNAKIATVATPTTNLKAQSGKATSIGKGGRAVQNSGNAMFKGNQRRVCSQGNQKKAQSSAALSKILHEEGMVKVGSQKTRVVNQRSEGIFEEDDTGVDTWSRCPVAFFKIF